MRPDVYWIDAATGLRLAIMPRPRAGDWLEDEIAGWRLEGVDVVVSLLEPDEAAELGLQREAALCTAQGMRFLALPIPDRGVPVAGRTPPACRRVGRAAGAGRGGGDPLPRRDRPVLAGRRLRARLPRL